MANLRGFSERTGNKAKQITKQATAARLQPPKISSRSHLLTSMTCQLPLHKSCDRTGDLHANHPSSSSLRDGAGKGAPGDSCVGSCTYPLFPNGFSPDIVDSRGLVELVLAGTSASLRLQPRLFMESRKEAEVILLSEACCVTSQCADTGA